MPHSYSLHVRSVSGIQWRRKWPMMVPPNLDVAIEVDGIRVAQTHRKRHFVPMWNSLLPLWVLLCDTLLYIWMHFPDRRKIRTPSSVFSLFVITPSGTQKHVQQEKLRYASYLSCVAKEWTQKARKVSSVARRFATRTSDVPIQLTSVSKDLAHTPGPALVVRLARIGRDQAIQIAIADAGEDSAILESSLGDLLESLTSSLDVIIKIGGAIAKIHPFAEMAYNILTSVYNAVKKQHKTDQSIAHLVQTMVHVYSFTKDVNSLPDIEHIEGVVSAIVQETAKCALFIREYTAHTLAARLVGQIRSEDAQTIQDFMAAFDNHKQALDLALGVHIAFAVNNALGVARNTLDSARRLEQLEMLQILHPVKTNVVRDGCLPGTRRDILSLIITELSKPFSTDSPNIFWLYGVAGAGKSTIAISIHQCFDALGQLGASLFFTRGNEASSPNFVIRTIAHSLAESNTHIGSEICLAMRQHPHIVDASFEDQFQRLLVEPLDRAKDHIRGPIIIILDALDECGDSESRRHLVSMISNRFSSLPMLRVFITSRPDLDIAAAFRDQSSIIKTPLDITKPSSLEDIRLYLDAEMVQVRQMHFSRNLDPTWPGHEKIAALGMCAAGLFIWASTATRYLRNAHDPNDALDHLLEKGSNLDRLYAVALQTTKIWEDQKFAQRAQACLSVVVLGKVPMSDATIDSLLGLDPKDSSAHVFFKIGCVLQWAPGESARILHASFGDYLTDHSRCGQEPWFIDPSFWGPQLTRGCLRVLKTELRFNICRLEESHICNTAVHDLPDRIATYIPPHLSYSSRFWADHMQDTEWDEGILADIEILMYNKFPFWLEVLSILGEIRIVTDALRRIGEAAKRKNIALAEFLGDAIKFVVAFAPAFAYSTPHLYLSALPLAPSDSSGLGDWWPALQTTIKAHNKAVHTVAFSPGDGERIASGSSDTTICVWDARTGVLVAGPFIGHSDIVRCIAFSPDGARIVSGSYDTTVQIWDSQTGILVAGPIQHSDEVNCVAFSPDGEQVVSGSDDGSVYVWNSRTGAHIAMLEGHRDPVLSVAFSPEGDWIASGSKDHTFRIWDWHIEIADGGNPNLTASDGEIADVNDGRTVNPVTALFEGHSDTVTGVAFSPDGERIVSGSHDNTLRVWNSRTGALVAGPIQHGDKVWSVAFSPDGEQIVSGSADTVVRVWNARTGTLVAGPFRGHNDQVSSVAFSPDGHRIVSGSSDHTLCVWDAHKFGMEEVESEAHSDVVWSVGFSPDGERIVSGSTDGTVRVWDSRMGNLITGPIQTNPVYCVAFSPDGEYIASGSEDCTICVWSAETGDLVTRLVGHTGDIFSVAFSPGNGDQIASGATDSTVRVWDARKGILVAGPFKGHTETVSSVAFSPDGERIVSGSYDTTVRIWHSKTGVLVAGPIRHSNQVKSVSFSPDGRRIVLSFDTTVRVLDAESGTTLLTLPEWHSRPIYCVAFSPDGKRIASGSHDRTVRVWPTQNSFHGHSGIVLSVAFSPDGNRVVSSSGDGTIRIHEVWAVLTMRGHANLLMSQLIAPDQLFEDGSSFADGWILTAQSQLILWIPPWLRDGLYLPQDSLVISASGTSRLDLTQFVHGASWEECMDPRFRIN
ncbi:WD40 repeat-like protein [Mycena venus]|uniref:WD40 repeat-like protein n=1 Tax=Mycena venus TaxID=2733690 RepID=A0A8H6YJ20_9AGAR|nr:WD40 repeat-like protein [Mycena venus]